MLSDKKTYTTLPVTDLGRARAFYEEELGIKPVLITEGGVMYSSGGCEFFVYPSRIRAAGHTQMSWRVPDIKAEVASLRAKGIEFERYEVPGVEMVNGIAHVGPEVWTAWFKDPDGNLLGLTQIGPPSSTRG